MRGGFGVISIDFSCHVNTIEMTTSRAYKNTMPLKHASAYWIVEAGPS